MPAAQRYKPKPVLRFYGLEGEDMLHLKPPLVDAPMAALGSSPVLPADSDSLPKDHVDRKIELAAKKGFPVFCCGLEGC